MALSSTGRRWHGRSPHAPPDVSRLHPAVVVGGIWAAVAVRVMRARLERAGLGARVPGPPPIGPRGRRGVEAALRRFAPTCLERALVEQAWLASQGEPRDVVIGVPPEGMKDSPAHAWVDGRDPGSAERYLELHRVAPTGRARRRRTRRPDAG